MADANVLATRGNAFTVDGVCEHKRAKLARMTHWPGILLIALSASSASEVASAAQTFSVQASIDEESLRVPAYLQRGVFWAHTIVRNTSSSDQRIRFWTQYGWSWISSNEAITPGIEAMQNIPREIVLKPGQSLVKAVELFARPDARRPIAFRLGFYPLPMRPGFGMHLGRHSPAVSWSNQTALSR